MNTVVKRLMLDMPPPWLLPNFPLKRPGTAAWWGVADTGALRNSAGTIPASGDAIKLVSDKSGNSAVNALVLNGVAGNYASSPDSAAVDITGDIDLRAWVALNDWTPGATNQLINKATGTGNQRSYQFAVVATTGLLRLIVSTTGADNVTFASTVAPTVSDFGNLWTRATLDVNNGSGNSVATFYTSSDGATWNQLGDVVTGAVLSIFNSTSALGIGASADGTVEVASGQILRAQIYNGIDGTLAFDANFTAQSKLATSFPESSVNAATVTINTSGATGARISGARDLYWGTAAGMPILTVSPSGNYLTGDGADDAMRSAMFSLPQPVSRYIAGSQTTWTSGDYLWDGVNGANSGALIQTSASPQVNMHAGSSVAANTDFALATRAVISEIINGASSSLGVNRLARTTGNAGAASPNGFTLFASGASTAANFGNGTFSECVLRSVADDAATRDMFIRYLMHKWRVSA